ncbi:copper resistance CopC family protein [Cellulomonas iranensis]|uniref:copper resistance CopC family protein n=1 Tax=Cellulomonas iranensis TaxID=76862 RepID=UPI001F091D4D|nr:copper resistance CopC family protein [Cellulomonas iranensis]
MTSSLRHALGRAVAVSSFAGLMLLGSSTVASAHDQLIDSVPEGDQRLEQAPVEIRLEFSAEVMDVGAAVVVADAAGEDQAAGAPVIAGRVVTVPLEPGLPDGGYTVRWRVVSSDGHPIAGSIPFGVRDDPPSASPAAPDATSSTTADPQGPQAGAEGSTAASGDGPLRTVLVAAAGAGIAAGVYAVVLVVRRRALARAR